MKDGSRDPELIAEQQYVSGLYDLLAAERREAEARMAAALAAPTERHGSDHHNDDMWQRDAAVRSWSSRSRQLGAARSGLCFGRLDRTADPLPTYIGRIGLFDDDRDEQVLTDWRAPAARAFYCATVANPDGVIRRRHFHTNATTVVDFHDDVFDGGTTTSHASDSALMAALSAPRTGTMRDIVTTIQAEQDTIIRLPLQGTVVIEGGPGTGKTAVALHRIAFLFYEHRERLARRGVLVVGPSPAFLDYIGDVLPSLGETAVVFTTPGMWHHGVTATAVDPPAVATIKGGLGMVDVLRRAVADRQELPGTRIPVELDDITVMLDDAVAGAARDQARDSGLRHNEAREVFRDAVGQTLVARAVRQVGAGWLRMADLAVEPALSVAADLREELRANAAFHREVERLWPLLTPQRALADLYGSPERLAAIAVDGDLGLLHRAKADAWTVADAPLLDELAELLGPLPERATDDDEEEGFAAEVLAMLDDYADEDQGTTAVVEGLEEGLSAADLLDASEMAERHAEADQRDLAERAVADREWTYGHVVVDEAQELSAMDWHVLLRRCPTRSITAVGDLAQRGSAAGARSWAGALERYLGTRWKRQQLTVNYRTPAEFMALAARVLPDVGPGLEAPESVRRIGVEPWIKEVPQAELAAAVRAALAAEAGEGTAAVIVPDGLDIGVDVGAAVLTATATKGLEFDVVIVVEPGPIHAAAPSDLYVALTRATRRLGVLHTTPLPACLQEC